MNSAVKQLTRTTFGSVGRWACLASLLLGVPASGQILRTADSGITIRDATLDPADPTKSRPRASLPYGVAVNIGTSVNGKTIRPEHKIQRVEVVLPNLAHSYFADLDVALTGPGGNQVMLLSDVAVNQGTSPTPIPGGSGLTLTIGPTLDGFSSFPAGQSPVLASGNYLPTNREDGGVPDVFDTITTPTSTDLTVFRNLAVANTEWKLYVMDDRVSDAGSIGNWQLKVWTSPYITIDGKTATEGLAVDLEEDTTKEVTIAIDDLDSSPLTAASFSIASANTSVLPNTRQEAGVGPTKPGFSVRQDGANWKLALRANDNANTATAFSVTLTIAETHGSVTFPITINKVTAVNDKPVITAVRGLKSGSTTEYEDVSTLTANQGQISAEYQLKVDDPDGTADVNALVVSGKSTGANTADIAIISEGSGKDRVFRLSPLGAATGSGTYEIYVTDPSKLVSDAKVVTLNVAASTATQVRANADAITVPDAGTSVIKRELVVDGITASGTEARIQDLTVTLAGVNHKNPADLVVVLQKEGGKSVVLLNNTGGTGGGANELKNARLTFSDAGATLPTGGPLVSGIDGELYKPLDPPGTLPSGFPSAPESTIAAAFGGEKANGKWILNVIDRTTGEAGSIAGGFILNITPRPVIAGLPTSAITFTESVDSAGARRDITVTLAEASDAKLKSFTVVEAPLTAGSLLEIRDGSKTWDPTVSSPQSYTFKVNTVANKFGRTQLRLTLTNSRNYVTTELVTVDVTAVNGTPTITEIQKQTVWLGQVVSALPFTVGDSSELITTANKLTVTASSSNTKLLPTDNIVITPGAIASDGKTQAYSVSLFPAANETGEAVIRLTVADSGQKASIDGTIPDSGTVLTRSTELRVEVKGEPSKTVAVTSPITINDSATAPTIASPYPSATAEVKDLSQQISTVKVNLYGITARDPNHVTIVLRKGDRAVVLTRNQGGSANTTSPVQLRFDDDAASPIAGTFTSGLYQPSSAVSGLGALVGLLPNVTGGVNWSSVSVFNSFEAAFENQNPNGVWELYVVDSDSTSDGVTSDGKPNGIISSWMLTIETKPSITDIVSVTTTEEKELPIVIDVGDPQPGVPFSIVVTEITSPADGALLDDYRTDDTELGDKRSITLVPTKDIPKTAKTATARLRVSVTDGQGNTATDDFDFVVNQVNDPPTITGLGTELRVPAGTISPTIPFNIGDVETAISDLTVEVKSDDTSLLPQANIVVGGSGVRRTITILPNGARNVSAPISVTVKDKGSLATTDGSDAITSKHTFTYIADGSGRLSFANSGAITIPADGQASPYVTEIPVSGVTGSVGTVIATVYGFTHKFPDDVTVVLESPGSSPKRVVLMSNAGGSNPANSIDTPKTFVFRDDATDVIPDSLPATVTLGNQNYRPAAYSPSPTLPVVGSVAGIPSALSTFAGINPNGTWKVYVFDDTFPDAGAIAGGFSLAFETAPDVTSPSTLNLVEDVKTTFPMTIVDSDTTRIADFNLTAVNLENPTLIPNSGLKVIKKTDSLNWELEVTPALNQFGDAKIRVTVTDGKYSTQRDLAVKVASDNDAPEVRLGSWFTPSTPPKPAEWPEVDEDAPKQNITLLVRDVDTVLAITNLTIVGDNNVVSNANARIVGPTTIPISTSFTEVTAEVTPSANKSGKLTLVATFSDGSKSVSTNILFSVKALNDLPQFVPATYDFPEFTGANSVKIGQSKSVTFGVTDIETDAKLIKVTAVSDSGIIPSSEIQIAESGNDRTLTFRAIGNVGATNIKITVTVEDANGGKIEQSFFVDVDAPTPDPGKLYANTAKITIPGASGATSGKASPYASEITVPSTVVGDISQIEVILEGFKHAAPDDVDLLLVAPDGTSMIIFSDAGGTIPVDNLRIELTDSTSAQDLRDDGPLTSGTFRPRNFGGTADPDLFPDSGVTPGTGTALSVFKGKSPRGIWRLFAVDDSAVHTGEITGGWAIRLRTTPVIQIAGTARKDLDLTYNEDGDAGGFPVVTSFVISDPDAGTLLKDLTVTTRSDDPSIVAPANIVYNSAASTLTVTSSPHRWQNDTRNPLYTYVDVTRPSDGASWTLRIKNVIAPKSDDPIISRLVNVTIQEGEKYSLPLRIVDNDNIVSGVDKVTVTVESLDTTIVRAADISPATFTGVPPASGLEQTVLIGHVPGVTDSGTKTVTIRVTATDDSTVSRPVSTNDGDSANDGRDQEQFQLTIIPKNDRPVFTSVPSVSATSGALKVQEVIITDPDTIGNNITLTATSLNTDYIKNPITVSRTSDGSVTGQSKWNVSFTPELNVKGEARIRLVAKDEVNTTDPVEMVVNIGPSPARRYNYTGPKIIIRDATDRPNTANPYPAIVNIPDLVGDVASIRVEITEFSHPYPDDVDAILVSPSGAAVKLFSDTGGSTRADKVSFSLVSDSGRPLVPDQGAIVNGGVYRPADYETDVIPNNDPAIPSGPNDFSVFIGKPAKGDWKLYLLDDTRQDSGELTGFSLIIETQPRIEFVTTPPDQNVVEDKPFSLQFRVIGEEFFGSNYEISFTSSDASKVNPANLTATLSEGVYTVSGRANDEVTGSADITITAKAKDYPQFAGTGKFKVTITAQNDAPFFVNVPSQVTFNAGTFGVIEGFDYGDPETPKKDVIFTAVSSEQSIIPNDNIFPVGNRLFIFPAGTTNGTSTITLTAKEPGASGQSTSTNFVVVVQRSPNYQQAKGEVIAIRDNNTATPYPSTITVPPGLGRVSKVTVSLSKFSHEYPADADILLVGPNGNGVVLFSDVGGGRALTNAWLNFDDDASTTVPANPVDPVPNGSYKPTNNDDSDTFASPAPAKPTGGWFTSLNTAFRGIDPRGDWRLFVVDDTTGQAGEVEEWILNIFSTEPVFGPLPERTTDENVAFEYTFQINDADTPLSSVVVTATADRPSVITLGPVVGTGRDRSFLVTPVKDVSGESSITLTATDGVSLVTTTTRVIVRPVNQGPTIEGLSNTNILANRTVNLPFMVRDNETAASALTVTASVAPTTLGSVSLSGSDTNRTLTFVSSGTLGDATVTVSATDGALTTTTNIVVTIGQGNVLVISTIAPQTMDEGGTLDVPFTVANSAGSPTVVASSSNTALFGVLPVSGTGTNLSVRLIPVPGQTGEATITLSATEDFGTGTGTFTVKVNSINAPEIAPIPDQQTFKNVPAIVPLSITDADTPVSGLTLTWTTSNSSLVRNVTFGVVGGTQITATVLLVNNALGTGTVTIFVDDGRSKVGQSFLLTVSERPNLPPTLGQIPDQTTSANTPVVITLNLTDPDTALTDMAFSSATSNPSLVSGVTVDVTSGAAVATVNLVADATGIATVTISANDGRTTVSSTFALAVTEGGAPTVATPTLSTVNGVLTITVTWSGGGTLQSAPTPNGPWTSTGNSTGSFSEPATDSGKFYRVAR